MTHSVTKIPDSDKIIWKNMIIRLAIPSETKTIVDFFARYILRENDAIYSEEFFCPDGVSAAIKRGQIIVAIDGSVIAGAVRFYRKKKTSQISLYQYAVDENYRKKDLLMEMLTQLRDTDIIVICPTKSSLNQYYLRTGWLLLDPIKDFNQWCLKRI